MQLGAAVEVGGWRLEVLDVDRRAITRVRLVPYPTRPRMHLPDNRPKNWCQRGRDRKIHEKPNVSR